MFEFLKLCNKYENLNALQRGVFLTENAAEIIAKLKAQNIEGIDAVGTLAAFIVGSIVSDGKFNENEYLMIYPALIKVFGDDFDFASLKQAIRKNDTANQAIKNYTENLLALLANADESLRSDIISLCLCTVAVDGKISLKEKKYIRRLCKA